MTTLIGNTAVPNAITTSTTAAAKKRGWLPLLTVLFLISYGIMTMLIIEQGQTIESQRALIRELFRDSTELSASKMKTSQEKNLADAQHSGMTKAPTQAPSTATPAREYPSNQIPTTQAPAAQAPSAQAVPQRRAQMQAGKGARPFQMPSRPASDLADDLRALILI